MDCSPPGSSVHGISQVRILEGELPFLFLVDLPNPGIKFTSPAWQEDSLINKIWQKKKKKMTLCQSWASDWKHVRFLFILLESRRGTMLTLRLSSCTTRDTQAHHLCHHNRASQHPKSEPFIDWQLTINSGMYPINWANISCQPTELWANQRLLFKQLIFFNTTKLIYLPFTLFQMLL